MAIKLLNEKRIDELKIKYKLETRVEKILIKNNEVLGVRTNREIIQTDKIILATGGKSYPLTGSTGDGYKIARDLGHTIIPIRTFFNLLPPFQGIKAFVYNNSIFGCFFDLR